MKTCVAEIKHKKITAAIVEYGYISDRREFPYDGSEASLDAVIHSYDAASLRGYADKIVVLTHGCVKCGAKIAEKIQSQLEIETVSARAIDAAALAEAKYSHNGAKSLILIKLGRRHIEGSFLNDGVPYYGWDGTGGDFAHNIINAGGRKCECGRSGCFEAYCTGEALGEIASEKLGGEWNAHKLFTEAASGNKEADALLDEWNKYLAAGVTNIMNLFQPEYLCFSGELSKAGDALLNRLHTIVDVEQYARNSDKKTTMCISKLGEDAALLGGALI